MKEFLGINLSNINKAKYLSRLFGIFYEDLMIFCLKGKGYTFLGRPSLYNNKGKYLHRTFDYTFQKNGKIFIAEAKCWVQYENFRHIELTFDHLKSELYDPSDSSSFQFFLDLGSYKEPYRNYKFKYKNHEGIHNEFSPDGKILFWAKVKKNDLGKINKKYHISYIFSIEDLIYEIKNSGNNIENYNQYIIERKKWTNEIFRTIA